MTHDDGAASPAPDHTRRGGSGPKGPADPTEEYVISVGDVLSADDPEPPAGTEVELSDGNSSQWQRWKRVPLYAREWPYGVGEPNIVWSWSGVTAEGPVVVRWLAPPDVLAWDQRPKYAMYQGFPGQWRPVTWETAETES